jgi:hypothetical protein
MGLIPASGSAISMGRVRNAYGLGGGQVALRGNEGAAVGVSSGAVPLSTTFGGKTTPNAY